MVALFYNFVLIVLWFYFDYMLCHEIYKYGIARAGARPSKYLKRSAYALKVVQFGQILNIPLAIVGVSKTALLPECLNVFCRAMFCYVSVENFDENSGPFVLLAFIAFGIAEPIRYPYYLLKILDFENHPIGKFFGHLRFNLFILFYPLGALCDGLTTYYASENMRKLGHYSLLMPN